MLILRWFFLGFGDIWAGISNKRMQVKTQRKIHSRSVKSVLYEFLQSTLNIKLVFSH